MFVARVVGNVWATRKHSGLEGSKLLLVQKMDCNDGKIVGDAVLAVEQTFGAGPGDTVLLVDEGNSSRQILKNAKAPVRLTVCGVVDTVHSKGKDLRYH
ncbi:MAG: EutN/CcmL family microcompartment protein [Elusimicrobia bacterium]|nr:EutN/CcmL family microcompartment protein [Elusimicrobiota bacterium]